MTPWEMKLLLTAGLLTTELQHRGNPFALALLAMTNVQGRTKPSAPNQQVKTSGVMLLFEVGVNGSPGWPQINEPSTVDFSEWAGVIGESCQAQPGIRF